MCAPHSPTGGRALGSQLCTRPFIATAFIMGGFWLAGMGVSQARVLPNGITPWSPLWWCGCTSLSDLREEKVHDNELNADRSA